MNHHALLRLLTVAWLALMLGCAPVAAPVAIKADTAATRSAPAEQPDSPALVDIVVFFKLDSALTSGLFMGDRWVSPTEFDNVLQAGTKGTVVVKVRGVNAMNVPVAIRPAWLPADPDMVTVTPNEDQSVTIAVHRAGTTELMVKQGNVSKRLGIVSTYMAEKDRTQVVITQETHD